MTPPPARDRTDRRARRGTTLLCAAALLLTAGCQTAAGLPAAPVPPTSSAVAVTRSPSASVSASGSPASSTPTTPSASASTPPPVDRRKGAQLDQPFVVNGIILVNKKHAISRKYVPAKVGPWGLTAPAQAALTKMIAAARKAGVRIIVKSGYRSYATQAALLAYKIRQYGNEALARRFNAAPGRSEHQTGLAADLYDGVSWGLGVRNTKTGIWMWKNAWKYGFILRYPPGKESITGYHYEPWHFRYIGVEHSRDFGPNSTLTLEEYLGVR